MPAKKKSVSSAPVKTLEAQLWDDGEVEISPIADTESIVRMGVPLGKCVSAIDEKRP
jgi:hypothetical protein